MSKASNPASPATIFVSVALNPMPDRIAEQRRGAERPGDRARQVELRSSAFWSTTLIVFPALLAYTPPAKSRNPGGSIETNVYDGLAGCWISLRRRSRRRCWHSRSSRTRGSLRCPRPDSTSYPRACRRAAAPDRAWRWDSQPAKTRSRRRARPYSSDCTLPDRRWCRPGKRLPRSAPSRIRMCRKYPHSLTGTEHRRGVRRLQVPAAL